MVKQYEWIIYEKNNNGVAVVTFNRPDKMNSLSLPLLRELGEAMLDAETSKDVKVIILTGKGKAFCAGADLGDVNKRNTANGLDKELEAEFHRTAGITFGRIENCTKPLIAAVNGYAIAGGFEICLWCDIIIASETARIGDGHANYILMGPISTNLLPRQIGYKKTMELLLTGDLWPAQELERAGFVNRVVSPDKLMETAMELAVKIAEKSPMGSKYTKAIVKKAVSGPVDVVNDYAFAILTLIGLSKDRAEGVKAFAEKRKPRYTGE
jgi:enoyl-CoA hydratase